MNEALLARAVATLENQARSQGPIRAHANSTAVEQSLADIAATLTTANSKMDTLLAQTNGLEGSVDGLEALQTTLNAQTDTLEALLGITNALVSDFDTFEGKAVTLLAATDTTVTFAQEVRSVVVSNWDDGSAVLVKDGAMGDLSGAAWMGAASLDNLIPCVRQFAFKTTTIHLYSAGTPFVTLEGYF